jgi:hypothetical protein
MIKRGNLTGGPKGQGTIEFGDRKNAEWFIKNNTNLIAANTARIQSGQAVNPAKLQDQIVRMQEQIVRAKAFISSDEGEEKLTITKPWMPTWAKDDHVARYYREQAVLVKAMKEWNVTDAMLDAHLVDAIEAHRGDNDEGQRMGNEFWTDAADDIVMKVAEMAEEAK